MIPITDNPAQHILNILIILGTFSATSLGNIPVFGSASSCLGLTIAVDTKLNTNAPNPNPASTIPPTSPLFSGKYRQLL